MVKLTIEKVWKIGKILLVKINGSINQDQSIKQTKISILKLDRNNPNSPSTPYKITKNFYYQTTIKKYHKIIPNYT
jgi:hypothetical protein